MLTTFIVVSMDRYFQDIRVTRNNAGVLAYVSIRQLKTFKLNN